MTTIRYAGIIDELKEDIRRGSYAAGDRMPSFKDLQARFGTTSNTITRTMMELERLGLVTRERGRGVFVAEPRTRQCHAIGLVNFNVACTTSPYYALMISGVEQVARREGYEIVLLSHDSARGLEKVDGVIVHGEQAELYIRNLPAATPSVSVLTPSHDVPCVGIDDFGAAFMATRYLLGLGHRRIGFTGHKASLITTRRHAGYLAALEQAHIVAPPCWTRYYAPQPLDELERIQHDMRTRRLGQIDGRLWLADDWHKLGLTAVVVQSDEIAIGFMQALHGAGIRVPHDVSVIGFDDTELCEMCSPGLTSVHVPLLEIGTMAAEALMRQIREEAVAPAATLLPTHVTVRGSTAPALGSEADGYSKANRKTTEE
jgi:DNA-binding LacI/PurR family transcriptional regulator